MCVPVVLTCLSLSQLKHAQHLSDPELLFSPLGAPSQTEKSVQQKIFPSNYSIFDPGRMSRIEALGRVLLKSQEQDPDKSDSANKDRGMLELSRLAEVLRVDQLVRGMTIWHDRRNWTYSDLCARGVDGECWHNGIVTVASAHLNSDTVPVLTYPMWFDFNTFQRVDFPFVAGGIKVSENNTITSIEVVALNYFLRSDEPYNNM